MTNEKQKKTTEEYRNNYDAIFQKGCKSGCGQRKCNEGCKDKEKQHDEKV